MAVEMLRRRLHKNLVHKIIKQLVEAVDGLHRAGVVHGNVTTTSLMFSLPAQVHKWTDAEVYDVLGEIRAIPIHTEGGEPLPESLPPGVPKEFFLPTEYENMTDPPMMLSSVVLGGFGQSFLFNGVVGSHTSRTLLTCLAPETHFEKHVGFETDVWQLGCAIYEIRAGEPLFNPIVNCPEVVLGETEQFAERDWWFSEDGKPKYNEDGEAKLAEETSIHELLTSIGDDDPEPEYADINPTFEEIGVKLTEVEVELLRDPLEKMLRYKPEDRIKLPEVMQHPYMAMRE